MLDLMRLYKRPDSPNYYVEVERGKSKSLKTDNPGLAKEIFDEMVKEELRIKLHLLDPSERITVAIYKDDYVAARQDLSGDTLRADELALRLLGDVVGQKTPMRLIGDKSIEDFKKVCLGRKLKSRSVNTYLRHIKAALREARELGYIKKVPRIKFLKEPKRLPQIFERDDYRAILKYLKKNDYEMWRIGQFALWTGCRRAEIKALNWNSVGPDSFRVVGKGDKERVVDLLPGSIEVLGERRDIGPVFKPWHKDTITHRFKECLRVLKLSGKFHMLRHTSATVMLNNDIGLHVIQSILGHADISTTQIYAKVYDELRKREMQKLKF